MAHFFNIQFDNRTISILKTEIQQQFKKTYGKPFYWRNILKSGSVKKVFQDLKLTITIQSDVGKFRDTLRETLKGNEKYQMFEQNEKDTNKTILKIRRTNKYEGTTDYKSLIALVQRYPGGLLVDEQLTKFTFKDAKTEIERANEQKRIKRIYKDNTKDEYFYIFPRHLEIEYEIRQDSFKFFGMTEYLDLCSHLNAIQEQTDKVKQNKERSSKQSNADPNYKLPGYLELKEKWLKKNAKK